MWGRLGAGGIIWVGLLILIALLTLAPSPPPSDEQVTPTPTTVPFLHPPFAHKCWDNYGHNCVTSYFDHHFPDRQWDDTITIFTGDGFHAIDGIESRTATFRGGYRLPGTDWHVYYDGHNAFDYDTDAGRTILAAAPGEVIFADSVPSSCATPLQYVCIRHVNGYRTYYLHLEGICVRKGQWVETGDPLGISGNSGCSLGPHLHFAVQHNGVDTDPYGWRPQDEPDPLIAHSDAQATWLWVPPEPMLPIGRLTQPLPGTMTNGALSLVFIPAEESPPIARVEFLAFHQKRWHHLGTDENKEDGWSLLWDTRSAPEGKVWLHAWAVGTDGRVGKGSPILTDITVDRHPPQGYIIGLSPRSADTSDPTAGRRLWLYAASYDPESTTQSVSFFFRESGGEGSVQLDEWRPIGEATWLHTSSWLLVWDIDDSLPDGTEIDVVARLTDGAGNAIMTQPVQDVTIDRSMPGGELVSPASSTPFTTTLDLLFVPFQESSPSQVTSISHVAFYVWHDGDWHEVGVDRDGSDGWAMRWDPTRVEDQPRLRAQARVYDTEGRVNRTLPQVTDLTLDRTPPSAGYIRPAPGGVARPDVAQSVWAWDEGSGVDFVEFYLYVGDGWLKIGEDRDAEGGWTMLWDAQEAADGIVDFSARAYDRAGNAEWTKDVRNVALDRNPPMGQFSFPGTNANLSGVVTLTLDVTDTVSGLDRAVFYARYDDRWHHLGADVEPDDGFSIVWDSTSAGERSGVTLTAWVYDRAGNHVELPHISGIVLGTPPLPTATPSPTLSPPSPTETSTPKTEQQTATLQPTSTATRYLTPSSTPTSSPVPKPTQTARPSPSPAVTRQPTARYMPTPTVMASSTGFPTSLAPVPPVSPAFWYLIGGGVVVALALLILSLRNLRVGS